MFKTLSIKLLYYKKKDLFLNNETGLFLQYKQVLCILLLYKLHVHCPIMV